MYGQPEYLMRIAWGSHGDWLLIKTCTHPCIENTSETRGSIGDVLLYGIDAFSV